MEPWDLLNPAIFIDHRERRSGFVEALKEGELFDVQEKRLDVCDLQICDVGIERKTGEDLVDSLADGRLFRQLILMRRLYRRRIFLVEGEVPVARLPIRQQEGLWVRISVGLQTPILRSQNVYHTATIVRRAALQIFGFTSSHAQVGPKPRAEQTAFFQRLALVSFPGIGLAKADLLLAHFGSLKAVLNASREELMAVRGIGARHADCILTTAEARSAPAPRRTDEQSPS